MEINFYETSDILPDNFSHLYQNKPGWIVSLLSVKKFFHLMSILTEETAGKISKKQRDLVKKQLFVKDFDISREFVPNSEDYVVYILKRRNQARLMRLYQCRWCRVSEEEEAGQFEA